MPHRLAVGQPVVYRGTEHPELAGQGGIVLQVLSQRLLLVALHLPDGRQPELKVAPEDVGVSEADAAAFLRPVRFDPAHRRAGIEEEGPGRGPP
jgi:hypothetical protein